MNNKISRCNNEKDVESIILQKNITYEVLREISDTLDTNNSLDEKELDEIINNIIDVRNLELSDEDKNIIKEEVKLYIKSLSKALINALQESSKVDESGSSKKSSSKHITIKKVVEVVSTVVKEGRILEKDKLRGLYVISLSIVSEILKSYSYYLIGSIDGVNKTDIKIILGQIALATTGEFLKLIRELQTVKLAESVMKEVSENISKYLDKNISAENANVTIRGYEGYGEVVISSLNNILPNSIATIASLGYIFSIDETLGVTALVGLLGMATISKKFNIRHTSSHKNGNKVKDELMGIMDENSSSEYNGDNIQNLVKEKLNKIKQYKVEKNNNSYLSMFYRGLPTYATEIVLAIEYALFLKDELSAMQLLSAILLVRGARNPISKLLVAYYEKFSIAVIDTDKLIKSMK